MPEAVTFRISAYHKLAKGEAGITQYSTERIRLSEALDCLFSEMPEEAVTITANLPKVVIEIDWSKVPEEVRNPKIAVRRR